MRSSDWSSDVCSSDLDERRRQQRDELPSEPRRQADCDRSAADRRTDSRTQRNGEVARLSPPKSNTIRAPCLRPQPPPLLHGRRRRQAEAAPGAPVGKHRDKDRAGGDTGGSVARRPRSEEHTSELQALMRNQYAVLCLKKQKA